ncbi:helix-turn-helix domain-containing protein [Streptomyces sp. BpilaLS-43]|uniref:helix-turn-helix domain-containing protein n=1 Tax=Streptomyces sp. BpilaLS-43 TaxID=1839778 RepID=UPI00210CDDB3|nr:helix-turn-helix transcriptional regulator [Streptomyces sp. BpilaLS-43]
MRAQAQARRQVRQLHNAVPKAQHMVVGRELRRLRKAQGLSQKDAADLLGVSKYTICRNETGETPCKPDAVLKALQVYRATPEERAHLLEVLDNANRHRWWQESEWRGLAKQKLLTLVTLEEGAQLIRVYDRDRVPGMLQTADYARAVVRLGMPGATAEEIDKRVQFRLERQARFRESQSARYLCLLDEVTLIRGFGSREIMRGQLAHLVELSLDPRFSLHVVELSRLDTPTGIGQTMLFDFEERLLPTVLYEERHESGLVCQEADEVDHRSKGFDRLLNVSLSKKRSQQRIRDRLART